jgi:O-antigen ligase
MIGNLKPKISFLLPLLLALLPMALITGPFLSELIVIIISIYGVWKIKEINYYIDIKIFYPLFFFNIFIIFRSLLSENIFLSLESSLFYFRFLFFSYGAFLVLKNNPYSIKIFTKLLFFTLIFLTFDAIFQKIFSFNTLGFKILHPDLLSGLFGDEHVLGSYLIRILPLFCALIAVKIFKSFKEFFIYIIVIPLAFTVIFYSGSRTALFLMFFLIFMVFFLIHVKIYYKILILVILIISFILGIFFDDQKKKRYIEDVYITMFDYNNKFNENDRIVANDKILNKFNIYTPVYHAHYITAYRIFKDNKIFGAGPKMFREICKKEKYYYNEFSCTSHPHNTYLQLLAETGLIGFSIIFFYFILILFYILKILFMKKSANYKKNIFLLPKMLLLLAFLINLMPFIPSGNFFNNWLSIIYYLPLPFIFLFLYLEKKSK